MTLLIIFAGASGDVVVIVTAPAGDAAYVRNAQLAANVTNEDKPYAFVRKAKLAANVLDGGATKG